MCGGVEMTEEDSTAVEGAGSALLGMGTSADWTKEDVGVHSYVLGDAGDVVGMLRGILTLGTMRWWWCIRTKLKKNIFGCTWELVC